MKTKILVALVVVIALGLNGASGQDLSEGLIAYYPLDTDGSDQSGNGHDGTVVGDGTAFVPGLFGGAFSSTNLGGHIVTSGNTIGDALTGLTEFSMQAWVKSNVTGVDRGYLSIMVPDNGDNGGMRYDSDGGGGDVNLQKIALGTTAGDNNVQLESSNNSQTTEWQHNLMTWKSGEQLKFYINGVLDIFTENDGAVAATIGGTDDPPTDLHIGLGAKDEEANESWNGLIDEVRIWGRVLSADEVLSAFKNEFKGLGVRAPSPTNGETDVEVDIGVITWEVGVDDPNIDNVVYDVYFGTDPNFGPPNPLLIDSIDPDPNEASIPNPLAYNTTYYWQIDTLDPNLPVGGEFVVATRQFSFTTRPSQPIITLQPLSVLIDVDESASFTVAAVDDGNFGTITFQWFTGTPPSGTAVANHDHISGADTATLTIDPAGVADSDDYFCVASNSSGSGPRSISDSAELLIKGIISYWRFEGALGTDPNDLLTDSAGSNDGTILRQTSETSEPGGATEDPTFESGPPGLGQAICFDGSITLMETPLILNTEAGTISHWLKRNTGSNSRMVPFMVASNRPDGHGGGSGLEIHTEVHNNAGRLAIRFQDGVQQNVDGSANGNRMVPEVWIKMTATWDTSDEITLYVNGEFIRALDMSDDTFAGQVNEFHSIGGTLNISNGNGRSRQWDGCIDEVRVYNYELNATQVATLFFNDTGEGACIFPIPVNDTTDDCIVNLEDLADWQETFGECSQVFSGGAAVGCLDPVLPIM